MKKVNLTNYPPPQFEFTNSERELPLIIHHTTKLALWSKARLKVTLKNLPSPSPPAASPLEHLVFFTPVFFIFESLAVASFAAVPALGCPVLKVGILPVVG